MKQNIVIGFIGIGLFLITGSLSSYNNYFYSYYYSLPIFLTLNVITSYFLVRNKTKTEIDNILIWLNVPGLLAFSIPFLLEGDLTNLLVSPHLIFTSLFVMLIRYGAINKKQKSYYIGLLALIILLAAVFFALSMLAVIALFE